MGDGKPSIIEKSYKLLFVIYAPIALLSYIINAIGGFKISFLSIFLISVSALSALLALFLVIRYATKRTEIINIPDSNKNAPFFFRHDFLIPFIFISITSLSVLSLLIYNGAIDKLTHQKEMIVEHSRTSIALVLGLSDATRLKNEMNVENVFYDYSASEIEALGLFLRESKNHGNNYSFELVDHQMKYSQELEDKIISLMKSGITYFICTTSQISVPLSNNFEQLITKSGTKNTPILICTNSSSPHVKTKSASVYRFFIRSNEQTKKLAKKSDELNLKTINFIAIDNKYGRGSIESFDNTWQAKGNLSISGIYLDPILSENKILEEIKNSNLLKNNPDGIFIVSNNKSLQAIIKALDEFPDDIIILSTSGLSVKNIQKPLIAILDKKRWFMSIPKINAAEDIFTHNIYTSFLYLTITKLTNTIEALKENPELLFHDEFTKNSTSKLLDYDYEKDGDFIIQTRLDSSLVEE